jgi:serine/threonine protein kinase
MMLLPKKVGPFTLMRRLGGGGAIESYVAILDEPAGKQVVARRVEHWLRDDARRRSELEGRVSDLAGVSHPSLITTLQYAAVGEEHFILSDWVDGVPLRAVLNWCRERKTSLPHNTYLDLATRICNGLEALHSRPGGQSGSEHVLHLALSPDSIILKPDGTLVVGVYGLVRSPTVSAAGKTAGAHQVEYLSPEQTHPDQVLTPATDIFTLGATLYEMLTLRPLFKSESRLQTMHRIRRAEVTTALLEVKEILPGLDKVLYRALSLNPRHRYQRAFVLREDLRGLMAGYSFSKILETNRDFIQPMLAARSHGSIDEVIPVLPNEVSPVETTDALLLSSLTSLDATLDFLEDAPVSELDTLDHVPALPLIDPRNFSKNDTGALLRHSNALGLDDEATDIEALTAPAGDVLQQRNVGTPPPVDRGPTPSPEVQARQAPAHTPAPTPPSGGDDLDDLDLYTPRGAGPRLGTIASGVAVAACVVVLCGGLSRTAGLSPWSGTDPIPARQATQVLDPSTAASVEAPAPRAAPMPAPQPKAAPASVQALARATAPVPRPEPAYRPPTPDPSPQPSRPEAPTVVEIEDEAPLPEATGPLAALGTTAHQGMLTDMDIDRLQALPGDAEDYTQAQALLYEDARARQDGRARRLYLDNILALPENQYRPEYLVEDALLALNAGQYSTALSQAQLAERHWARLPSNLVFSRRAAIFEVQAEARTGLFYLSEGDDIEQLDQAIRDWGKYRRHVGTRGRTELMGKADQAIVHLNEMRTRLETP